MKKLNYREIFIFIMVFILLIVLCMMYFLRKDDVNVEKNNIKVSNDNIIASIDNSKPISDDIGVSNSYKEDQTKFSIDAKNIKSDKTEYEIIIKQINTIDSINSNYIKVYLEDDGIKAPLLDKPEVFSNLKSAKSDIEARRLYKGSIKKNQIIKFKFKMWLSDSYTINSKDKQFDIKIEIKEIK